MDLFGSITSGFNSLYDTMFGGSATATPSATKVATAAKKPVVVVTKAAAKPAVSVPTVAAPAASGFSLSNVTDFLEKVGNVAEKGINTFFTAKSNLAQLQAAQKLEDTKLKAIVASAQTAPAPAQVMLPSVSDWLSNPQSAAQMVYPAAIAGSTSALSIAPYILGGAALLYVALKRG